MKPWVLVPVSRVCRYERRLVSTVRCSMDECLRPLDRTAAMAADGTGRNSKSLRLMPPMSPYRHTSKPRFPVLSSNEAAQRARSDAL